MKIYMIRAISFFMSILTASVIFSFSGDNAQESAGLSSNISQKILSIVGIDEEDMSAEDYAYILMKVEHPIRKLAHFSEYFLLGLFLYCFIRTLTERRKLTFLLAFLISVLYAMLDEWHQAFVPGRGPGIKDVMIDGAGAFCGVFFAVLLWCIAARLMKKRKGKIFC